MKTDINIFVQEYSIQEYFINISAILPSEYFIFVQEYFIIVQEYFIFVQEYFIFERHRQGDL